MEQNRGIIMLKKCKKKKSKNKLNSEKDKKIK